MAGTGVTRAFQPEPRRETASTPEADPFLAFNSESPGAPPAPAPMPAPFVPPVVGSFPQEFQKEFRPAASPPYKLDPPVNLTPVTIGLCIGLAGIATAGVFYFQLGRQQASASRQVARPAASVVETHGTVSMNSRPEGARVLVDGKLHGATPLTLSLPRGTHDIELQNGTASHKVPLTIAGGETISQVVDLAPVEKGFVAFRSPLNLRVSEGGKVLGTTSAGKLSLSAGRHELELASPTLDFRTRMTVYITPGQTAGLAVDVPQGTVSINALPWADVFLDGRPVGITPLANLRVPIGSHEIVWRHPTLGERKRVVNVTAKTPVRVGMDLRQ
jgi:serine/threonine-protein kinase